MNKNIKFVLIFFGILALTVYLTASFSKKGNNNTQGNDVKINDIQNGMWAAGDYGQAKKNNLDIKKLQEALIQAKNPQDFEEKVNAIYQGDEIVSINVENKSATSQFVHLYIDKNPNNGKMDEEEKILSLEKRVNSNQENQILTTGYGNYAHYSSTSPFFYGMAGSMIGNWLMSSPSYSTPMSRQQDIKDFKAPLTQKPSWGNKSSNVGSWKNRPNSNRSSSSWFSKKSTTGRSWGFKMPRGSFSRRR